MLKFSLRCCGKPTGPPIDEVVEVADLDWIERPCYVKFSHSIPERLCRFFTGSPCKRILTLPDEGSGEST
jgi:hypothetical protein